jgi:TRAP-type C4-dicarboxylate transport system permease small subunit
MDYWALVIRYVLFATPIAILIIASFRYVKREKSTDAKLLFLGSSLAFLTFTCNTFFFSFYVADNIESITLYEQVTAINVIVGLIGMFLFAFGFLMFFRKYLRQRKDAQNEVDQIGKG